MCVQLNRLKNNQMGVCLFFGSVTTRNLVRTDHVFVNADNLFFENQDEMGAVCWNS